MDAKAVFTLRCYFLLTARFIPMVEEWAKAFVCYHEGYMGGVSSSRALWFR